MEYQQQKSTSGIIVIYIIVQLSLNTQVSNDIYLQKLSTLYLPYNYINGTAQIGFDKGAVEQVTYDYVGKIAYLAGNNIIHVVELSNVESPVYLYHQEVGNVAVTDIEFCGNYVLVAFDNSTNREHGHVRVYRKYNSTSKFLEEVQSILVGNLPDMIKPTNDCRTVVIALEAEGYSDGTTFKDPEGGVGLIKFLSDDLSGPYSYKKLDFKKFNDRWEDLVEKGVRFVYRENGSTFSQDVEPEYIDYNSDETVAYISLQENNAIAKVSLIGEEIEQIHPLGFKDWSQHRFDASDKDNKINIQAWPVYGMYQPDSIRVIYVNKKPYLLTANEGDAKDYEDLAGSGWSEQLRFKDIWSQVDKNSSIYKWSRSQGLNDSIARDENLGRLKVSRVDGKECSSTYSTIYTYGGRGFSIYDLENMSRVYDSGGEIETKIAEMESNLFNSNPDGSKDSKSTFDKRSDDKGPETESLAVAQFDDRVVFFIGNERPGIVAIYSIGNNVTDVRFESMWTGIKETNGTWDQLYDRKAVEGVDPEDIRFIDANRSPNKQPLLLVAGAVSGTLSIFQVKGMHNKNSDALDAPNKFSTAEALSPQSGFSIVTLMVTCLHVYVRG